MFLRRITVLGLSLFIAHGCVTVPKQDLAEKMTTAGCDTIANLATQSGFFAEGNWPKEKWWEDFEDQDLNALIDQGLKNSPTLKRAESRLKAAAQAALQRKSRLYPEVNFDAIDNWQHLSKYGLLRAFFPVFPAVINQIDLDLDFYYEFDFWGKNRDLFKAALGEAAAKAADKAQAELVLTTSIAYSYYQVQFFLKRLELLEQMADNKDSIAKLTSYRMQNALSNQVDNITSSNSALESEAQTDDAEISLRMELHRLKALTGLGQDGVIDLKTKPLKEAAVAIPSTLSLDLLARRPDLSAQLQRLESAAKEIDAAKTDFYPNFNLHAFIGLESIVNGKLFKKDSYMGSLAPAVHLPIFTAGRLKAQLFEKVAMFNEAVHIYDDLILQAAQEVADNLTSVALLSSESEKWKNVAEQAKKRLSLVQDRFANALDDKITVLESENSSIEAELNYLEIAYARQLKAIQLIKALGGGFGP